MTTEAQTTPDNFLEAAEDAAIAIGKTDGSLVEATVIISEAIFAAVIAERERCALIAEGDAKGFDFQNALAEGDDINVGVNTARLAIAKSIRGEN